MIIAFSGKIGSGKDTSMLMASHYINTIKNPTKTIPKSELLHAIRNCDRQFLNHLTDLYLKKINFKKAYFGKNVKKIVCVLLGCTLEQLEDINFKNSLAPDMYIRYKLYVPDFDIHDLIFSTHDEAEKYCKIFPTGTNYTIEKNHPTVRDFLVMVGNDFGRDIIHPNTWACLLFQEYKGKRDLAEKIGTHRDLPLIYPNWFITDLRYRNEGSVIEQHDGIIIRLTRSTPQPEHIAKSQSETDLDDFKFKHLIDNSDGDLEKLYDSIAEILKKYNYHQQVN